MTMPNDTNDQSDIDDDQTPWTDESWHWDIAAANSDDGDDGDEARCRVRLIVED